ncbi:uncharacterized protein [Spinacia oleracea]|uniref:Uncharacterized protein isoform X2 n=1 Tax=Spinacia oleracea TaxID=3562 RepID=A0ABM3RI40_SPIOL|nr:uncharacterized protein LOC110785433 isoform X2 [Spinacia oleracea]
MAIGNTESEGSQSNSEGNNNNFDPYFIANSDNPTSSLVAVPFNGANFVRWSRNVKRALIAKNKEGFINGELLKPTVNHKDYLKWKRADFMVVSWILSSMNHDLADDFGYIDNAADLWLELAERFGQSNGPLIYQLKKEIENLTQENMTIVSYYSKLKKLWDEMQTLRAFPTCTCGVMLTCSCQFLKKVAEFEEEDKMMKFLLGLNGGFDSTITNVLAMDPMPNLNRVFSITQQIEKQKEVSNAVVEHNILNSSAMAAQFYKGNQVQKNDGNHGKKDWKELKKEKLNRFCTHCKGKGHTAEQCFKIIGYPDWYNSIKASKGSNSSNTRFAANVNSATDAGDDPLDNTAADNGLVNSTMLNAICQEVMKVMKGQQSQNTNTSAASCSYANYAGTISHSFNCTTTELSHDHLWIVDSGACDHMTFDENILTNIRVLIQPIKVGLPDGTQMTVEKIGDTVLSDDLVLHNVLLVKGFRHNLLSVGRLIEHTGILVTFTKTGYIFQDPSNSKKLGAGKRTNGLYYFVTTPVDICQDIDECKESNECEKPEYCINQIGSYHCKCPKGYHGNGTRTQPCSSDRKSWLIPVAATAGVAGAMIILLVIGFYLYWKHGKIQHKRMRESFFRQNGGLLLHEKLSGRKIDGLKVFTAQDLEIATNNYNDKYIIGRGGFGIVYKGILGNNQHIAIKRSLKVDPRQVEQFINEVLVLSQINNRNVVKLLGCCLETEVPLLVYEFITNGTLYDHLVDAVKASILTWNTRLNIALEVANVLSYLHTTISTPIIHRDMKSMNILLDDNYTAKVADFGASRLVPEDQGQVVATMVQGTWGYLDPEYMQTRKLTEKSDVYSFGVVLVELITRKKAICYDRPDDETSLAMHLLIKMREGDDRPSMKEVAIELETIKRIGSSPWISKDGSFQEDMSVSESLLEGYPRSGTSGCSSSIDIDLYNPRLDSILADGR